MTDQTKNNFNINEDQPTEWFEKLYASSNNEGEGVPWANMSTHPIFKNWLNKNELNGNSKSALVVGCGMGDDALELEQLGFQVTAFDVAQSAIDLCKKRFPHSSVDFVQADLLAGIPEWKNKFDFILEIYTIQALPPKYENTLVQNLSSFLAPKGELMLITEVQFATRNFEVGPPWLLNPSYIGAFENLGLSKMYQDIDTSTTMGDESHLTIFKRK
ncbi:class I SAM-dependent methyltransferase [Cyclobacteriaceae bacterium]|nr:class I SAM-dependent methyltransferase [Cyclobacteriaceae bacterium]